MNSSVMGGMGGGEAQEPQQAVPQQQQQPMGSMGGAVCSIDNVSDLKVWLPYFKEAS